MIIDPRAGDLKVTADACLGEPGRKQAPSAAGAEATCASLVRRGIRLSSSVGWLFVSTSFSFYLLPLLHFMGNQKPLLCSHPLIQENLF